MTRRDFRARAVELLVELERTDWGRLVAALVDWGRRQLDVEAEVDHRLAPALARLRRQAGRVSYVRWGEQGSDVYVYERVGGYLTCCGCGPGDLGNFDAETVYEMVAHLENHRVAGHVVPPHLFTRLTANKVHGLDEDLAAARAGIPWVRRCPVTADRRPRWWARREARPETSEA